MSRLPLTIGEVAETFTHVTPETFDAYARVVKAHQAAHAPFYAPFAEDGLPLPVEAFKHSGITTFDESSAERVFMSSGTGSGVRSRHPVKHLSVYERAVLAGFDRAYGDDRWVLVAYLPQYAPESSLVYMTRLLMQRRAGEGSGWMLEDADVLYRAIEQAEAESRRLMLLGAAFGLVDFVERETVTLPASSIVIETGGMKTHRREMSREELRGTLSAGFGVPAQHIRSEYGMCELMSQAYSDASGLFQPPPWLQVRVVDPMDPTQDLPDGEAGVLRLFDLANCYTVSDLVTQDVAVKHGSGFEVRGRLSKAELRGCNHLVL